MALESVGHGERGCANLAEDLGIGATLGRKVEWGLDEGVQKASRPTFMPDQCYLQKLVMCLN